MEFHARPRTIIACVLLLIGIALYIIGQSAFQPEYDIEACVDCVHYASAINDMVHKWDHVEGNPQFFDYALMKSCRGAVLVSGNCRKFRRDFRADRPRYMKEMQIPYDACVSIKACQ
ncbi:hypothetical protein BJX99DRAFT_256611 [Aspergillus californicus]